MRFRREVRRVAAAPALGVMLAAAMPAAITACSGSPSSSSSPPAASASATASAAASSAAPPAGSGASSAAAATIKANWVKFFAPSTPASQRVSLLQNGQKFASTIKSMFSLGASAKAKVTSVSMTSSKQATVTYTVYLGGQPALPNAKGVAVLEDGTWKVSDPSFCELLTLQNAGKAPSVCSSAS